MAIPVGKPVPVTVAQPQVNTYTIALGQALAALGVSNTEQFISLEIVAGNLIIETTGPVGQTAP